MAPQTTLPHPGLAPSALLTLWARQVYVGEVVLGIMGY